MIAEFGEKKLVFKKEGRIFAMLLFVFYIQSLRPQRPLRLSLIPGSDLCGGNCNEAHFFLFAGFAVFRSIPMPILKKQLNLWVIGRSARQAPKFNC
jgi:hypothetical protein